MTEYTHNFDEFRQYVEYMQTQEIIKNLQVQSIQKMETVKTGENEKPNPKCIMKGRKRQYITATFEYKNTYVGLLELENNASTSTWVISSKNAFGVEIFDTFLNYYVEDDMTINDMKKNMGKNPLSSLEPKTMRGQQSLKRLILLGGLQEFWGKFRNFQEFKTY
ncbi:hypothetical protein [Hydrogenimonas sp.]